MLLRNPKVGRPTGLVAETGVDSVRLEWDPNGQSRVCGYNVYRAEESDPSRFALRASPSIPRHHDLNLDPSTYYYKVSSVSRLYTTGNSIPTESESKATDPVCAELGKVPLFWSDTAGFVGDEIAVNLGIRNSLNIDGAGLSLTIAYDTALLQPVRVVPSGLTTNVNFTQSAANGVWVVTASEGEIAAGGGTFFSFVFKGLSETNAASVSLSSASMQSIGGSAVLAVMPTIDAQIMIERLGANEDPTVVVPYSRGDLDGDGVLTKEDKKCLAQLMNGSGKSKGKIPTAEQLRAGDYNGDGRLDQNDYQLMKDDFKARGVK